MILFIECLPKRQNQSMMTGTRRTVTFGTGRGYKGDVQSTDNVLVLVVVLERICSGCYIWTICSSFTLSSLYIILE